MKKYLLLLCAIALAFTACKHQAEPDMMKVSEVIIPPPPAEKSVVMEQLSSPIASEDKDEADDSKEPASNRRPADIEKKIIKEGEIRFETGNVAQTHKQLLNTLKRLGGYAEDDSETTDGVIGSKEYTLVIRIPANNFDTFLGAVSSTATKIDSRNIRVKDITTQFIDTKARLDNKIQLEKRYINLLNRAGKMRDLLDIEQKLTEIRSDIDATQGQLNYMSKQVAFSSLNLTFYTKQPEQVAAGNGFGYKFKHALTSGWDFLQDLFFGLLSNWPSLIIITVFIVLIRRWRRKTSAKQA